MKNILKSMINKIELVIDRTKSIEIAGAIIPCLSISDVRIHRAINEHSFMRITGTIAKEMKSKINQEIGEEIKIRAFQNVGGFKADLIFAGVIEKTEIINGPISSSFSIEANSFSIELDRKKRKRSFQDIKKTYSDLISAVKTEGKYEKFNFIPSQKLSGEKQKELIVQYEESDWEFLKRINSHIGEVIVLEDGKSDADISSAGNKGTDKKWNIWLGFPDRGSKEFHHEKSITEVTGFNRESYLKVSLPERLEIGDKFKYAGFSYLVTEAETKYSGNIIENEYKLVKEDRILIPLVYNTNIAGKGVMAEVVEIGTEDNLTRVRLDFIFEKSVALEEDIDGIKLESKLEGNSRTAWEKYWFRYSTPYSGTNTGIYMMPEVGDRLNVHFINSNENSAYAGESLRKENSLNEDDPDVGHKRIIVPTGQQIILSEKLNKVRILGNKDRSVYIDTLSDAIDFTSGGAKGILKAEGISFEIGDSKFTMMKDKIEITCGSASISLASGGKVSVKGS